MGSPLQYEQVCALDNNNELSYAFAKQCASCPHKIYDYTKSNEFHADTIDTVIEQDDGYLVSGHHATDNMCIGMFGTSEQYSDPHTTVCQDAQPFFLVMETLDWNWSAKATNIKYIDSVCGLGMEKADKRAQGWIARAAYDGQMKNNTYSIQLVP